MKLTPISRSERRGLIVLCIVALAVSGISVAVKECTARHDGAEAPRVIYVGEENGAQGDSVRGKRSRNHAVRGDKKEEKRSGRAKSGKTSTMKREKTKRGEREEDKTTQRDWFEPIERK